MSFICSILGVFHGLPAEGSDLGSEYRRLVAVDLIHVLAELVILPSHIVGSDPGMPLIDSRLDGNSNIRFLEVSEGILGRLVCF